MGTERYAEAPSVSSSAVGVCTVVDAGTVMRWRASSRRYRLR
jgi:hypothetical protein